MHLNNVRSRLNEPKELGKLLLHLFVPIGIIHIQGDDGTAIIYGIIGCCMLFAAGLSWKYIIGAFAALAAAAAAAFAFFSDKIGKGYQWYRILAVIDPNNETGWAPARRSGRTLSTSSSGARSPSARAASSATASSTAATTASPTPTMTSSSAGSATRQASWAAAWCWACCWPSSSRPSPPERTARICWAPSSAPHRRRVHGPDIRQRRMNLRLLPVIGVTLPSTRQAAARCSCCISAWAGAVGVYAQYEKLFG